MSDVETEQKREQEQRREEDERLDTAEDERRGEDATEEVRRAFPSSHSSTNIPVCATWAQHVLGAARPL
jgi:hypothetical protein